jgi:hypothetical protein
VDPTFCSYRNSPKYPYYIKPTKPQLYFAMPPMRSYRPDFRSIYKNLNAYDREQGAIKMDSTYDIITKIVDVQSLNEAETASLVQKYTLAASVHHPEKCLYALSYLGFGLTKLMNILPFLVKL